MRVGAETLTAIGASPWITPNPLLKTPTIALAVTFSIDANLTCKVQYTYDTTSQTPKQLTLTRTGTSLAVNYPGHKLLNSDSIEISQDPNSGAWNGNYDVTVVDKDNFTVVVANSGAASAVCMVRKFRLFTHPTLTGLTGTPPTRVDASQQLPDAAVRLYVSAWAAGNAELVVTQGGGV